MAPGGKSVEEVYQKISQLDHILLRPDTYIGSVELTDKTPMWIYDSEEDKLLHREISFVPGLYKIFDEILVNAADNKQRDPEMNTIRITIDAKKNEISVFNNGRGIPIVMHKTEKMYVPELIFGTLLTSSNYNDEERKVTGGRNGYGAKLCNIFSAKFVVETKSIAEKKLFKQTWKNNMQKCGDAVITDSKSGEDYTKITFRPDLTKFKMDHLDDDIVGLLSRRAYDVAGSVPGVKVYLNDKLLPCKGFRQYVEQYTRNYKRDGEPLKVLFDKPHERWEIAVTVSDRGFQQVSFVNSIATTKGGRHVDYVVGQITKSMVETVKKKLGKEGLAIKPFQIKNHLWIFVNALIENPGFSSQTKEMLTTRTENLGSKFTLDAKFLKDLVAPKNRIVDSIMQWAKFKEQEMQAKKCKVHRDGKIKGLRKLEDANNAGPKKGRNCTLILTEGDSAKSLAVAGLSVIGRDSYGVFPLRGKMLNVRGATHRQIVNNAEVKALLQILGLHYKKTYETEAELDSMRYGKMMIMTDQDQDGSHVKGLIINFIHHNWPKLIQRDFLEEFITPIIKATKEGISHSFYSVPEHMEWRRNTDDWKSYKIKYYKGLGTSSAKEAKEYFMDIDERRIKFEYGGSEDDDSIELVFSKEKIDERKTWLTQWMAIRKERQERGEFEDYLYGCETRSVTFSDFVNKELILFSNGNNERTIPSLVDGLKPGQRKVMFTCFQRDDREEVRVTQLAGTVGEMTAYHHEDQSLTSVIIKLAHDFVGSNNVNLLMPNGQFRTRLQSGKETTNPRYLFTQLNPVTRALFQPADENVLHFLYEEDKRVEPQWYCPVIPTILVNGARGIGTGWSTSVPNYNPREVIENIRRLIRDEPQVPLIPWYRKFRGEIKKISGQRFVCFGEVAVLNDQEIEITELPIGTWTQTYKEKVLEPMLEGSNGNPGLILDFKEYHTEETVKFVVKMKKERLVKLRSDPCGLHTTFKLQTSISTTNMILFDATGCLRKFNTPEEVCLCFFEVRKRVYIERKDFLEGMLQAQSDRLSEQARFIMAKIDNAIHLENKSKAAIIDQLVKLNFKPDPVKTWEYLQKKKEIDKVGEDTEQSIEEEADEDGSETDKGTEKSVNDYEYLLGMDMWKLSTEDKDRLLRESDTKQKELGTLQRKSWSDLWEEDLAVLLKALEAEKAKDSKGLEQALVRASQDRNKGTTKDAKADMIETTMEFLPSENAVRVPPCVNDVKTRYNGKRRSEDKAAGIIQVPVKKARLNT